MEIRAIIEILKSRKHWMKDFYFEEDLYFETDF